MSLYFELYGFGTTKVLSDAGKAMHFFIQVLRGFFDLRRKIDGRKEIDGGRQTDQTQRETAGLFEKARLNPAISSILSSKTPSGAGGTVRFFIQTLRRLTNARRATGRRRRLNEGRRAGTRNENIRLLGKVHFNPEISSILSSKTPSGAEKAMHFFIQVLRGFFDTEKQSDKQEKLNKTQGRIGRFKDKNRTHSYLNLTQSSVHIKLRHHLKTIANACGENARPFPTVNAALQSRAFEHSKRACTLFSEASTSKLLPSSVAGNSGEFRGIFNLSEAFLSVRTARRNASRIHSTAREERTFKPHLSQSFGNLFFHEHPSVLIFIRRQFGRSAAGMLPHFNPSTALCAVSQ